MEENKSHTKDRIFAAIVILVLCFVATAILMTDSRYVNTKESAPTTVKTEGNAK